MAARCGGHARASNFTCRSVCSLASKRAPITARIALSASSRHARSEMLNPRVARLLVVDDEPMIGRAIRRSFVQWDVSISESAAAALKRFDDGERFDAIVCDMMMPNMTGGALYDALVQSVPEQAERMIFVTGGALTPETRAFVSEHADRVVQKPFDLAELERRIRARVGA
ncbi:MAG: response regulator [Polyangiaceae bacterium]